MRCLLSSDDWPEEGEETHPPMTSSEPANGEPNEDTQEKNNEQT